MHSYREIGEILQKILEGELLTTSSCATRQVFFDHVSVRTRCMITGARYRFFMSDFYVIFNLCYILHPDICSDNETSQMSADDDHQANSDSANSPVASDFMPTPIDCVGVTGYLTPPSVTPMSSPAVTPAKAFHHHHHMQVYSVPGNPAPGNATDCDSPYPCNTIASGGSTPSTSPMFSHKMSR